MVYRNCLRISILFYYMEGKVHHRTGRESPEGTVISTLDKGRWLRPRPGHFTSRNKPGTIVQETGWAPIDDLDGCEISRLHRGSIIGLSSS
jgi:hypothetical protein